MRRRVALFCAVCFASIGRAEPEVVTPQAAPQGRPVRVVIPPQRVGIFAETPITLDDVVSAVLANNRDIEGSRIDRAITSIRLIGARGVYDPRIGADGSWVRAITPVSSSLGGGSVPGR